MADELHHHYLDAELQTLYALLRQGRQWAASDGSGPVAVGSANLAAAAIQLSDAGTPNHYFGDFPEGMEDGTWQVEILITTDDGEDGLVPAMSDVVVRAEQAVVIRNAAVAESPGSPPSAGKVIVSGYVYGPDSVAVPLGQVKYRLVKAPTTGGIYSGADATGIADGTGYWEVEVWQGAEYMFWAKNGQKASIVTTDGDATAIVCPSLLSDVQP